MVSKLWAGFIVLGLGVALLTNQAGMINTEIVNSTKNALEIIMRLLPLIALWNGLMTIASDSGLLKKVSQFFAPLFSKIFPEVPKDDETISLIATDFVVNMVGLGSASTPIGLKVMKNLQAINKEKDTASRSMITFLIMNTAGFTIIPTTIIALRAAHNSINPTGVVGLIIITTLINFSLGLLIDRLYYFFRRNK